MEKGPFIKMSQAKFSQNCTSHRMRQKGNKVNVDYRRAAFGNERSENSLFSRKFVRFAIKSIATVPKMK